MISIIIKKEDLINVKDDLEIEIYKEKINSNISLKAHELLEQPKYKGWKNSKWSEIKNNVFSD